MFCTNSDCNCVDSRVLTSSSFLEGLGVRRRRECLGCYTRFNTYEIRHDDLKNKEIMKALNKKLKSELEIETINQTINQIEMIKKELDNVSMRIKKIE